MAYKAQLVVRTRDKEGTEIIERVKGMAEEQEKSFSEMALELLDRGLNPPEAGEVVAAPRETREEPAVAGGQDKASVGDLGPAPPVGQTADQIEARLDEDGLDEAAASLADYFAVAGAVEGGQIKKKLQRRLNGGQYEEMMEIVKKSDQYRAYKDRVLFGS